MGTVSTRFLSALGMISFEFDDRNTGLAGQIFDLLVIHKPSRVKDSRSHSKSVKLIERCVVRISALKSEGDTSFSIRRS